MLSIWLVVLRVRDHNFGEALHDTARALGWCGATYVVYQSSLEVSRGRPGHELSGIRSHVRSRLARVIAATVLIEALLYLAWGESYLAKATALVCGVALYVMSRTKSV